MPERVVINEVGPRDGLQNESKLVSTEAKLELINSLLGAGLRHIEVASFVSAKAVPQMADAADVYVQLPHPPGISYSVLVPNLKGYERARVAGADSIAVVLSCSETMNVKNINMTLEQATTMCEAVLRRSSADGILARAYLAVAFFCPFEGRTDPAAVLDLAARMSNAGARELIIADTIGAADPVHVGRLLHQLVSRHGAENLSGHFHDTKGLALANCFAALERGIRKFDSAIGGLGGCPFAPGAAGNVATEDLVNMLMSAGYDTGIDLEKLVPAAAVAEKHLGRRLGGRWMDWRRSRDTKRRPVEVEQAEGARERA